VDAVGNPEAEEVRAAYPYGSLRAIAGVINAAGNVAGLFAHPDGASVALLGAEDGAGIVRSLLESAAKAVGERRVTVGI
jgi:phosphoribosylformylglycinamidine (FGAM) synthase-like amidotransferase family enzyme